MKNTAVMEFLFVLATLAISGFIFIGCGGEPACADGTCGSDPTTDAGTNGDQNHPINKEDGGVSDSGDITIPDAGKDPCVNFNPDEGTWYNDDPQNTLYYGEAASISLSPAGEKKCTVALGGKVGVGAVFEGEDYPLVRQAGNRKVTLTKEGEKLILKDEDTSGTDYYHFSRTKPN